jgi:hypothetical protein
MNDLKRIVSHTARIAYAVLGKVQEVETRDAAAAPAGGTAAGSGASPAHPA